MTFTGSSKGYVDEWFIPLIRASSFHVYVLFDAGPRVHFTLSKVSKLHKNFFHPSASKLFNLQMRFRVDHTMPETLNFFKEFSSRSDPCQRTQAEPVLFRPSFGSENAPFDERIIIDIMYIAPVQSSTYLTKLHYSLSHRFCECDNELYLGRPSLLLVIYLLLSS